MPYFVLYGCRVANRRLEILLIRKPGVTNLNYWTGSRIQKPEVQSKVPEIVRNVGNLNIIRKPNEKSRRCQTGSSYKTAKSNPVLLVQSEGEVVSQLLSKIAAIFIFPVWPLVRRSQVITFGSQAVATSRIQQLK